MRPLLFLDVDGPLLPFGGRAESYPRFPWPGDRQTAAATEANPLLERLDPALGPRLAALPCTLVWATTWQDDANAWIAPRLGLPTLPVLAWPDPEPDHLVAAGVSWKAPAIVAFAAGRAFAWADDEITDRDRAWVSAHHAGAALLHRVDPRRGLTDADLAALTAWCTTQERLRSPGAPAAPTGPAGPPR